MPSCQIRFLVIDRKKSQTPGPSKTGKDRAPKSQTSPSACRVVERKNVWFTAG